jgi:hypothetical protein
MWQKAKQKLRKPVAHVIKEADIEYDLKYLNERFSSILTSTEEIIVFRPILANKIKPDKNAFVNAFQKNWRYLLFTNRYLYTMEPEVYNEGSLDKGLLIINKIDVEFLSHIIFTPKFDNFASFECLDPSRLNQSTCEEFSRRQVEMIIGFDKRLADGDVALQTDLVTFLQLVHAC